MIPILSDVEAVFFAAMRKGYASEATKKNNVQDMPGHKEIRYEENDFLLVDRWCVNPSGKSAGTTTIYCSNEPIWIMSYGGFYPKEMVSFLKLSLRIQYCDEGIFKGGRGPEL